MTDTEQKRGALKETLIDTDSKVAAKLSTAGFFNRKVTKENEVLYFWKQYCLSWHGKRELFAGSKATGQPLFSFKEKCSLSCRAPVRIASSTQSELAEMKRTSFWKLNYRFVIDDVEYEWKERNGFLSFRSRFELVEVKSSIPLAEYTFNLFSHKGVVTIYESGLRLSESLIVATALAMEGIQSRSHSGSSGGGAGGGS